MCLSVPGRVIQVQGAMAEVEEYDGEVVWFNALSQPDVKVGDYVLSHANLLIAIISETAAQEMIDAYREAEACLAEEEKSDGSPKDISGGGSDPAK